jgi:hypothetical protein
MRLPLKHETVAVPISGSNYAICSAAVEDEPQNVSIGRVNAPGVLGLNAEI